jgi:hypothetical protein
MSDLPSPKVTEYGLHLPAGAIVASLRGIVRLEIKGGPDRVYHRVYHPAQGGR